MSGQVPAHLNVAALDLYIAVKALVERMPSADRRESGFYIRNDEWIALQVAVAKAEGA